MTALPPPGAFAMVNLAHVAEVGPAAAILFTRISWRSEPTGSWRASRALLAQETGLPLGTIRGAVQVLRDRGWLVSERTSPDDATMNWKPVSAGQADSADFAPPPAESAGPPLQDQPDPPADFAMSSYKTVETTTPPIGPPADEQGLLPLLSLVPAPDPAPDVAAEFAGFWQVYPRRTGKGAAEKAYSKARRDTPLEAIAAGLRAQLPTLTARHAEGFCPHPTTWLNQRRWEDDVEQAPTTRPRGYNYLMDPNLGAQVEQQMRTGGTAGVLQ